MEDLKNNKIIWIVGALAIFNVLLLVMGKIVIDKAADRVIQRLQKDYSPSPYGPGFDPDKVDPRLLRRPIERVEHKIDEKVLPTAVVKEDSWRDVWERERGTVYEDVKINPEQ